MWCFGDSFDLYAADADVVLQYWDTLQFNNNILLNSPGRFGGKCVYSYWQGVANYPLQKTSGQNDTIHHFNCAFKQSAQFAAAGSGVIGLTLQLMDNVTNQCCIGFRSDGAIVFMSGGYNGTVLATIPNAFTLLNQWFSYEFEIVIGNTTGRFRVRINGSATDNYDSGATLKTQISSNPYANKLQIGTGGGVNYQYMDDVLWRSDASALPWIGDVRAYVRMPSTDVTTQFFKMPGVTYIPQPVYTAIVNSAPNQAMYEQFIPSINGTLGSIQVQTNATYAGNIKCALYTSVGDNPKALIQAAQNVIASPLVGTCVFTFSPPVPLTAGVPYFVAINADTNALPVLKPNNNYAFNYQGSSPYASWPIDNPSVTTTTVATFWFSYTMNSSTNHDMVNEVPQDYATTYNYSNVVGSKDLYGLSALSTTPASVVAVTTRAFGQRSDAGARSGAVLLKSGGTTVQSVNSSTLSTTWGWMWRTDLNDPNTGAPWTQAAVDNAQIGPVLTA